MSSIYKVDRLFEDKKSLSKLAQQVHANVTLQQQQLSDINKAQNFVKVEEIDWQAGTCYVIALKTGYTQHFLRQHLKAILVEHFGITALDLTILFTSQIKKSDNK